MTEYSIDILYAYGQIGLPPGAPGEQIEEILANAIAYRFKTRDRLDLLQRLVEFFAARSRLGAIEQSFEDIRKAYHRKAMSLHPDTNRNDPRAEEQLKLINADFALIESIHRDARDYLGLTLETRKEMEQEARAALKREKPERPREPQPEPTEEKVSSENMYASGPSRPVVKYVAASIPRFIRASRLSYLRLDCIIGSWFIGSDNDLNYVFDVVMLTEREFMRARTYLGVPDIAVPTLSRGGFTPPYIPKDIKTVIVPPGTDNPAEYVKRHFLKEFKLDKQAD